MAMKTSASTAYMISSGKSRKNDQKGRITSFRLLEILNVPQISLQNIYDQLLQHHNNGQKYRESRLPTHDLTMQILDVFNDTKPGHPNDK